MRLFSPSADVCRVGPKVFARLGDSDALRELDGLFSKLIRVIFSDDTHVSSFGWGYTSFLNAVSSQFGEAQKQSYRCNGINGIAPKRRGHPPKKETPSHIAKLIEHYRKEYRWGSEVIQAHLLLDHSIKINRYRIDRFLYESGLRKQYPCTTSKKKMVKKKKHTKKVVVHNPGEHTQMDVKYQPHLLQDESKSYVYNFIDHASNWSYKRAYSAINVKNTEDFMKGLLEVSPFEIERLQTDNGIEFTFKWASKHHDDPKEHPLFKLCYRESINHKLIPPGEKELQGLVERSLGLPKLTGHSI